MLPLLNSLKSTTIFCVLILIISLNQTYSKTINRDDKLELNQNEITLKKDSKIEVKIEMSDFNSDNLKIDCKDFCTFTIADKAITFLLNQKYFNIKDETKIVNLTYKKDSKEFTNKITVTIPARIKVIDPDEEKIEKIVEGEEITISKSYKYTIDNSETENTEVTFKPDNLIDFKNGKFIAKKVGTSKVSVLSKTDKPIKIAEFSVQIIPAIKSIELNSTAGIELTENSTSPLNILVKGTGDSLINDYSRVSCESSRKENLVVNSKSDGFILAAKYAKLDEAVPVDVTCKVSGTKAKLDTNEELKIPIKVIKRNGFIKVEELGGKTLLPNGSLSYNVRLFNNEGQPDKGGIVYELENDKNSQWVSLNNYGEILVVNWVDLPILDDNNNPVEKRPQSIKINVKATLATGSAQILSNITVRMASITRFDALKVKLNVMDERTVSDLYGYVTNEEYYVLMVRLFNDLKGSETNKSQGESILAYSSSIEIAVGLEKQYDKNAKLGNLGVFTKEQMKELETTRSAKVFNDYKDNLSKLDEVYENLLAEFNEQIGIALAQDRKAQELEIEAISDRTKIEEAKKAREKATKAVQLAQNYVDKLNDVYKLNSVSTPITPLPNAPINDGKWYPANRNDLIQAQMEESDFLSANDDGFDNQNSKSDGEPTCVNTITYRPFTFEMMVNTVDRRQERSPKSWLFKVLNFVSLGATTVSAIAVPGKGSDFPVGLEKFGNFFIPGLEKVIPSFKEQYRQNIVSQAMKPIEEIPFGSDITRVIFIPKKSIKGLIAGHKARISQICPFYFKIKVAVVSKGGEVTLGNQ